MTQMKFNTLSCIDNPDEKLRARRVSPVRIDQSISLIDINALKDWPDLCIECEDCMAELEDNIRKSSRSIKERDLSGQIAKACLDQLKIQIEKNELN